MVPFLPFLMNNWCVTRTAHRWRCQPPATKAPSQRRKKIWEQPELSMLQISWSYSKHSTMPQITFDGSLVPRWDCACFFLSIRSASNSYNYFKTHRAVQAPPIQHMAFQLVVLLAWKGRFDPVPVEPTSSKRQGATVYLIQGTMYCLPSHMVPKVEPNEATSSNGQGAMLCRLSYAYVLLLSTHPAR